MSGQAGATDGSMKDQQIAELETENRNLQEALVTSEEECQRLQNELRRLGDLQDELRRLREKVANARAFLREDEEANP
eukprot:CAMPEP_0170856580 /NCGR_PEP_ID=MMETSP0734-20130129/14682_1 /TAXON_ID=186038 /ORGANISM="Fragilariopsis kerguelensis, Strain L26-C5" /LENGTH=77 /DNA_ID=CAMNT_0011228455 /DNA_START=127 /DNA_END=360 /DNA_ORIENTATION=+